MIFGRPRARSAAEKLLDLRSQVGTLVVDQAPPVLSEAASGSAELFRRAVALLPVLTQYGDLLSGVLRWARNRASGAAEAVPAIGMRRTRRSTWRSRARRYAVAGAALAAGYAVYRLTRPARRA